MAQAALPAVKAVLFDAYGTLFDVYSVSQLAEQLFPGKGNALAALWRDKQIEYTRLCSMSGPQPGQHYRPFSELTRAALRHAAARLELPLSADGQEQLMGQYAQLTPFPENREVLQVLKAKGIRAGILSNGDPPMLAQAVRGAGLDGLLDPLLSVHEVRRFKTDPAAYALGPAALGLPVGDILFVSSNGWDVAGATWFGYTTLWVNRAGLPPEELGVQPHREGRSLKDVLNFFA